METADQNTVSAPLDNYLTFSNTTFVFGCCSVACQNSQENSDQSGAKIIVKGMTHQEWKALDVDIDDLETFEGILYSLSEEAQKVFWLFVGDMINIGLDDDDDDWRNDVLGESVDTLTKLKTMDDSDKLEFAPYLMYSILRMYVVDQVEECDCIALDANNSTDGSGNTDGANADGANGGDGNGGCGNGGRGCVFL